VNSQYPILAHRTFSHYQHNRHSSGKFFPRLEQDVQNSSSCLNLILIKPSPDNIQKVPILILTPPRSFCPDRVAELARLEHILVSSPSDSLVAILGPSSFSPWFSPVFPPACFQFLAFFSSFSNFLTCLVPVLLSLLLLLWYRAEIPMVTVLLRLIQWR